MTNAFGSIYVDPTDSTGNTLYAGSGEPNGSGDSEAGVGLFKSTNGGDSWTLVPGSQSVAIDRSIGSIAVDPNNADTIYIGTDLARHGSSSVNGGRRTPPNAPDLGVYKSTDGGASFTLLQDLHDKTPQNPANPATGVDWFQGGINKLEFDPHNSQTVYAAVIGYGLWRSNDGGSNWAQVFHTYFQSNFADARHPGDTYGDRTEFDAVAIDGGKTRIYLGDSSDDLAHAWAWRTDDAAAITGDANGSYDNSGWTQLSSSTNGTHGFGVYDWCQNGQCGYDSYVASPAGHPDQVWFGGSMNYDELPLYGGLPPRSNGRATVRSTNAGAATASDVLWQDMTATLDGNGKFADGLHPDLHAIAFDPQNPDIAFIGSDGGVHRVDVSSPQDRSHECDSRKWAGYAPAKGPQPLAPADLADCKMLLNGIPNAVDPINDGLATIQFQSLSVNPTGNGELLGGTQDNGTWAFNPAAADPMKWFESVGGDGGQSGFDKGNPNIRYHNYYDATPEVNFHGTDPKEWLDIYDPLQKSKEGRSFYTPFIADPVVGGRAFTGMGHVWRTNDNGGGQAYLEAHCNALHLDPAATCGDWVPLGEDLSSTKFGQSRVGHYVVATERAPSDGGTLWAATRIGRVFITKNANASNAQSVKFDRLDSSSTPGRFVSGIAVDPSNANHAWISYSGYSAYAAGGHVYEATYNPATHSATFTDKSGDLSDMPVTGIAQWNGDLYAATDFGVLRLPSGSSHWENAASGMPKVAVYGLTVDRASHTLYAATHGRGAYSLGLD